MCVVDTHTHTHIHIYIYIYVYIYVERERERDRERERERKREREGESTCWAVCGPRPSRNPPLESPVHRDSVTWESVGDKPIVGWG